jgi:hypothetical protein
MGFRIKHSNQLWISIGLSHPKADQLPSPSFRMEKEYSESKKLNKEAMRVED